MLTAYGAWPIQLWDRPRAMTAMGDSRRRHRPADIQLAARARRIYTGAMALRRGRADGRASAEQISRAVGPWLIIRVVEGLIAWLFFNEYFSIQAVRWLVQGAFVAYLLLNLAVVLRYRQGRASRARHRLRHRRQRPHARAADRRLRGPPQSPHPAAAAQGDLLHGGVRTARRRRLLGAAAAMLGAMEWADREVVISVVPLSDLVQGSFSHVVWFAIVQTIVGGPLATIWLRTALEAVPGRSRLVPDRDAARPRPRSRTPC